MKKFTSLLLVVSFILLSMLLCSCNASKECEYKSFMNALKDEEKVTVCVYGDGDKFYDVSVTDEFCELFKGTFEKTDRNKESEKTVSVTASMQYEMCLFGENEAMIYYGFCGVFQSDRQYYKCTIEHKTSEIVDYILANGTVTEVEE